MGLLDRIRAAQGEGTDAAAVANAASADVELTPAKPKLEWGKPGKCPECGGRGYLDHIDLVDRIMYEHCTECRHNWTVTEADVLAQA